MRDHDITRPLTEDDRIKGFIKATSGFARSAERWKERAEKGMTDDDLAEALRYELGIECWTGIDELTVRYKGAGLKIWISRCGISPRQDKPTYSDKSTIAMARLVYEIKDPANIQLVLF